MPKSKAPDERGDFIVTFTVKFPSSLSNEGKQLISQGFQTSAISEIHRYYLQGRELQEVKLHFRGFCLCRSSGI